MKTGRRIGLLALCLTICFAMLGCGGGTEEPEKEIAKDTGAAAQTLVIKGTGVTETEFTVEDLEAMAQNTWSYSGRSQEMDGARQYGTYTGVLLADILKAAGWDGNGKTLSMTASDGYNKVYELDEIESLYAFADDEDIKGTPVPAMILFFNEGDTMGGGSDFAAADGAPFQLVFGQQDYDTDDAGDFNMQNWMKYLCLIEVMQENE